LRCQTQHFFAITSLIPKDVHRLGERIQPEGLLDQDRQTVEADPEVDGLAMQVDLQSFIEAEHRSLPSASIIANRVDAAIASQLRYRYPRLTTSQDLLALGLLVVDAATIAFVPDNQAPRQLRNPI
jgi:hypothetical protein